MKRNFASYPIGNYEEVKGKLLEWTARFQVCCFLDNHGYTSPYNTYGCLAGAGASRVFEPGEHVFDALSKFESEAGDWIFGHFNYDLINNIDRMIAGKHDQVDFPDVFLFVPEIVIELKETTIRIGALQADPHSIFDAVMQQEPAPRHKYTTDLKSRIQKTAFIDTINKLKHHIQQGDCYEINFCQEFYAENTFINPVDVYKQLVDISPNPFSCLYRLYGMYALCASPERYIKKSGDTIISQPVKGTSARDLNSDLQDYINKRQLEESEKDKRENVIVVDLVRNDLSKVCEAGTVTVEELYRVYSFPTVHQMISTVTGRLKPDTDLSKAIEATFPMGSMTGAPKTRVMQLLEQYEHAKRGLYSGTIGYVSPDKDFDFNVVIRTIIYNATNGYLSYHTGSGITYLSDPEMEYEECLMKAAAVMKVFSNEA